MDFLSCLKTRFRILDVSISAVNLQETIVCIEEWIKNNHKDYVVLTSVHGIIDGLLILDDTLCEHVGSLFDYVDRHYNHGDDTYPLAHNPVTSHYVSGPVRFPVDVRLYRRYEEFTHWETFVHKHVPDRVIPTKKKERTRFHKEVAPLL